jgi:hypothetical protein
MATAHAASLDGHRAGHVHSFLNSAPLAGVTGRQGDQYPEDQYGTINDLNNLSHGLNPTSFPRFLSNKPIPMPLNTAKSY